MIDYGKRLAIVRPTAELALRKLKLAIGDAARKERRLARLDEALDAALATRETSWDKIKCKILSEALPKLETTEAIKERMAEVEYTSARPFITELEESVGILALMNLETPSNSALFSMVEKAIGKAVKSKNCEAKLLEKFREKRAEVTSHPNVLKAIQRELKALEETQTALKRLTAAQSPVGEKAPPPGPKHTQTQPAPSNPFTQCSTCNRKGHTADKCRSGPRQNLPVRQRECRYCGLKSNSLDFKSHNLVCPKKPRVTQTNRVQGEAMDETETIEVSRNRRIKFKGVDYIPLVTKVVALDGKAKEIPLIGYADTGARTTLVAEDFFQKVMEPRGLMSSKGRNIRVKGVDHTGTGVITNRWVSVAFKAPNGYQFVQEVLIVPGLPEHLIYGLEWQSQLRLCIQTDTVAEGCQCSSEVGGFAEKFSSETAYLAMLDTSAKGVMSDTVAAFKSELTRRIMLAFDPLEEEDTTTAPLEKETIEQIFAPRSDLSKVRAGREVKNQSRNKC